MFNAPQYQNIEGDGVPQQPLPQQPLLQIINLVREYSVPAITLAGGAGVTFSGGLIADILLHTFGILRVPLGTFAVLSPITWAGGFSLVYCGGKFVVKPIVVGGVRKCSSWYRSCMGAIKNWQEKRQQQAVRRECKRFIENSPKYRINESTESTALVKPKVEGPAKVVISIANIMENKP